MTKRNALYRYRVPAPGDKRDRQGVVAPAQTVEMKLSSGRFWRRQTSVKAPTEADARRRATLAGPLDPGAVELHFCCICGAVLGGDFEDKINGEGAGRDICGDCNRTKNDEAMFGR